MAYLYKEWCGATQGYFQTHYKGQRDLGLLNKPSFKPTNLNQSNHPINLELNMILPPVDLEI